MMAEHRAQREDIDSGGQEKPAVEEEEEEREAGDKVKRVRIPRMEAKRMWWPVKTLLKLIAITTK